MKRLGTIRGAVLFGLAAFMASGTWAQSMYRCTNGGSTYLSDRPCNNAGKLGVIGAAPARQEVYQPSYTPRMNKAADHLAYLNAECSSLNEAIRTAPARGLRSQQIYDLQASYREKCADEDEQARKRLAQHKDGELEERRAQQAAVQRQQAQAALGQEQCREMLRILHGKRQRVTSMTDGEKADLQRFEDNYNARCKRS